MIIDGFCVDSVCVKLVDTQGAGCPPGDAPKVFSVPAWGAICLFDFIIK